jgi:hypothetical protein
MRVVEREEGERHRSGAVDRKDGGRPSAVERKMVVGRARWRFESGFENGCRSGDDSREK